MRSWMMKRVKVVMAVLGFILSSSGLRAERFDIFRYKNCTPPLISFASILAV